MFVGVCNQITLPNLRYIRSTLVNLIKAIDVPIHIYDILVPTVLFKLVNFRSHFARFWNNTPFDKQ